MQFEGLRLPRRGIMKMAKLAFLTAQFISILFGGAVGCESQSGSDSAASSGPNVEIEMEDGGIIQLTLDRENAPITVDNFVSLVSEGFYDGLIFHRVMSGFMIQGGCPLGRGMGGSGTNITGEFRSNGVNNTISHNRGVVSMARSGDPDSASSQFFITHGDATFLDGEYAAFGRVTSGMEVVDRIASVETDGDPPVGSSRPLEPVVIKTIRILE